MADDKVREAIDVVAHVVLTEEFVAWDETGEWGNHPDIGEHDWREVAQRVDTLVKQLRPSEDAYFAAYEFLKTRTEDTA